MCISHYTLIFYYGNEYVFFTFWRNMLLTLNTYNGQLSNKKQKKIKIHNSYSWVTHHPCQTVILIVSFFASFFSTFLNEIGEMMLICLIHSFMFEVAVYVDYWHLSFRKGSLTNYFETKLSIFRWHDIWSLQVYALFK